MKYILGLVVFWSSLLRADTATVDENMWSWGIAFPLELTYINQEDGKKAYFFPYFGISSIDTYLSYDDFELHLDWGAIDFRSDSLDNHSKYAGETYGVSLFYALSRRVQVGAYMDRVSFISMSKSDDYEKAELKGYGVKFIYNPNRVKRYNEERTIEMNYTFSLGYIDGRDSTSFSTDYKFINGRMQRFSTKTHPDLSGQSASMGIMFKY